MELTLQRVARGAELGLQIPDALARRQLGRSRRSRLGRPLARVATLPLKLHFVRVARSLRRARAPLRRRYALLRLGERTSERTLGGRCMALAGMVSGGVERALAVGGVKCSRGLRERRVRLHGQAANAREQLVLRCGA